MNVRKYKSVTGVADISVGDLWGAEKISPEFNDNKGISFVLINSNKGLESINSIKGEVEVKEIKLGDAVIQNGNIVKATIIPANRKQFFEDLNNEPLDLVLEDIPRSQKGESEKDTR